jgi:hypothetical protein
MCSHSRSSTSACPLIASKSWPPTQLPRLLHEPWQRLHDEMEMDMVSISSSPSSPVHHTHPFRIVSALRLRRRSRPRPPFFTQASPHGTYSALSLPQSPRSSLMRKRCAGRPCTACL